jgi:hypothetical protein
MGLWGVGGVANIRRSTSSSLIWLSSDMSNKSLSHLSERERYLIALGLFVENFARCEGMLIMLLSRLTGVTDMTSRAVFSGVRSDTARSHIRRILQARQEDEPEALKRALDHVGVITGIRNDLMHYGANMIEGEMIISNEFIAMPGAGRKTPISANILTCLSQDLMTASAALAHFHFGYHGIPLEAMDHWHKLAQRAWLYKPPRPSGNHQKPRAQRPSRQGPPKSKFCSEV